MGLFSEMSTEGIPEIRAELGERHAGLNETPVGEHGRDGPAARGRLGEHDRGHVAGNTPGADECLGEPPGPFCWSPAVGTHTTTLSISSRLVMPSAALRNPS